MMSLLYLQRVAVFCIPTWSLSNWYGMSCNLNMFLKKFGMSLNETRLVLQRKEYMFRNFLGAFKSIRSSIMFSFHADNHQINIYQSYVEWNNF